MSDKTALALAACIRRAHNGPVEPNVERLSAKDEYYWHTREKVMELAFQLKIFRPEVIRVYEHETNHLFPQELEERSRPFWHEVQHPLLLVAEVMET